MPGTRGGRRTRRPLGVLTPCRTCPKIPAGAKPYPEHAVEFGAEEWAVWRHYAECKAVGWQVSDAADPVVRRNAGLLRQVEDAAADAKSSGRVEALLGLLARPQGGGKGK